PASLGCATLSAALISIWTNGLGGATTGMTFAAAIALILTWGKVKRRGNEGMGLRRANPSNSAAERRGWNYGRADLSFFVCGSDGLRTGRGARRQGGRCHRSAHRRAVSPGGGAGDPGRAGEPVLRVRRRDRGAVGESRPPEHEPAGSAAVPPARRRGAACQGPARPADCERGGAPRGARQ